MKSKLLILYIFFMVFCWQGCKKNKDVEQEPLLVNTVHLKTDSADGKFTVRYFYEVADDSVKLISATAEAAFYKETQPDDSLYPKLPDADVGTVSLNTRILGKTVTPASITYSYSETQEFLLDQLTKNPRTWMISGNGSYKKTEHNDYNAIPDYFDNIEFPDTMYVNQNDTIKFKFKNTDDFNIGFLVMYAADGNFLKVEWKPVISTNTEFIYRKSDFKYYLPFDTLRFVKINLLLSKETYNLVGDKTIVKIYEMNYTSKRIPLKL